MKNKKETAQIPTVTIEKIVVSSGLGRMRLNNAQFEDKVLPEIMNEFATIVGQRPKVTRARMSVAGFKVRAGEPVGIVATLRGKRKDDFLIKLVNTALPRVRDFKGVSSAHVDQAGNLNLGFKDQFVFPEPIPEFSKLSFGLEVTVVVKAKSREDAIAFYRASGIPVNE